MKLRINRRWEYGLDPFDPRLTWQKVEVLQFQGEDRKWRDVPVVEEASLTKTMKMQKVPKDLRWRIDA